MHRLDIIVVRIEDAAGVVAPLARGAVVAAAGCERRFVERLDRPAITRLEREVDARGGLGTPTLRARAT